MKKLANIKRVLDGFNGTSTQDSIDSPELNDNLTPDKFTIAKVARYGLPYHATCIAVDHVLKLFAIGTASGAIRICGKPGVGSHMVHESNAAVTMLLFLVNEGGLVSACNDSSIHIWSIRQNKPALIQSLNFKKERVTALHNPFGSKWLYVGTERGNVYLVNVESFCVSGYSIQWNHVIDVSCKQNPGPVVQMSSNPQDESKILLVYETGVTVLWDLKSKKYVQSYNMEKPTQSITDVSWNCEGKQFMTGHYNGTISTWNYKNPRKPEETQMPHGTGKSSSDNEGVCCAVQKVEWYAGAEGEAALVIFSGGMPAGNKNKGITLIRGRSKTLVLSDTVVDFQCLLSTPKLSERPEPIALFVLLRNEIVVFDLLGPTSPSLPWFRLPYTFNIHESPITCLHFQPNCPNDLLTAIHSLTKTENNITGVSKRAWPLTGGKDGELLQSPSLIITGHADGTVKFWDATSNMLLLCHKLRIERLFQKNQNASKTMSTSSNRSKSSASCDYDDPYAVTMIEFCVDRRLLTVVCQSFFLVTFTFVNKENTIETHKIEANFTVEVGQECEVDSPTSLNESFGSGHKSLVQCVSSASSNSLNSTLLLHPPFRTGAVKWAPGFQPLLIVQQVASDPSAAITSLTQCSAYGLIAFGNTLGVAIVDIKQKCVVITSMNYELGIAGEWVDTTTSAPAQKSPLAKTNSGGSPPLQQSSEQTNGSHSIRSRKERSSRMFGKTSEHDKLKRHSSANFARVNRDQEDGLLKDSSATTIAGAIQTLAFVYTYTKKGGLQICPGLCIGTSLGYLAVVSLNIPPNGEQRYKQTVMANITETQFDLHHCILDITHLSGTGDIITSPFADNSESMAFIESAEKHFLCITTEKEIRVKHLPAYKSYATAEPVDNDSYIVKADSMIVQGGNCICCLTTNGNLKIFSLPSLRPLLDVQCGISLADYRMIRTFTYGKGGEAIFLSSPSEIQRIVFTKEKEESFTDDQACLFTICQAPQAKPKGFIESFFAASPSALDREELFGPKSGTPSRHLAEHKHGSGRESLRAQADTAASAVSRAQELLIERGQHLGQLEDATARMNERAHGFSSAAKALSDKYQRKKWYQL